MKNSRLEARCMLTAGTNLKKILLLTGSLEGSSECREAVHEIVVKMLGSAGDKEWVIQAHSLLIDPEGAEIWIDEICNYLSEHKLIYQPSQLTLVVQYSDGYTHPNSTFEQY